MRALIRLLLVVVLLVVLAVFLFGWWSGSAGHRSAQERQTAPTATTGTIDTTVARERGAEFGEKAARATAEIKETVEEAGISSKIKAKMVLDDYVKARSINVSTHGSTVRLTGTVASQAEHDRAVRLARETDGVTNVVDELRVER
jgi:osmotically-inducible protein OsmY